MRDLRGKTTVVTGAGSGIGRSLALALAREGMHVGLLDVDTGTLEQVQADIRSLGVRAHALACDVSNRAAVLAAAEAMRDALGPVDVLCSNAGVGSRGPILETSFENFDWLIAVNLTGAFNVVKAFVPPMKERGSPGHVLVTVSVSGMFETPKQQNGVYGATKHALFGMTRMLRDELAPHGIGVTALCPGMVTTNSRQSGRHRPERFGGPFERPDSQRARVVESMAADDVGRIAVRAIRDDVFVAATHPHDTRRRFVERNDFILAEIDRSDTVVHELGINTTLPALP